MKKLVAAIVMAGLIAHAYAETPTAAAQGQAKAPAAEQASSDQQKQDGIIPGAGAAGAAEGNLTPVYVGAAVAGVAVVAGALSGGGSHDGTSGTGGTTGTTGTTGTH
ncbi:hypothetical protein [Dyella amyloliquefaciens]|uniref:hypothetical protein n=1 Tax=Dyella amyloliquefaciens TaxID=1770545 RepID=UPI00102EA48F|nr:hypothetical protein [Dyella amyloliquefaciens]